MRKGILLILLLICGVVFAQQTENFSGHWLLVKTMPVPTTPGGTTTEVTQSGNNFAGTQTAVQDGKMIVTPFGTIRIPARITPGGIALDIVQSGNEFVVTQTGVLDGEKTTEESKYTLDGAENVNTKSNAPGPPTTIRSTSSWNNGILILQGTSTSVGPEGDVVRRWEREYFLSADHTALTVRETHPTPFGDAVVSRVYGK